MKFKKKTGIDARYRSLLQKAVRRGHVELIYTVSALLKSLGLKERNWFTSRAAIIAFEECWPLGAHLKFNKKFHSKVAALIKVAQSTKARDATGLGYLAFALYDRERSVLNGSQDDTHVKIVAHAIARPKDFWKWIDSQKSTGQQADLIKNAIKYRNAGSPQDCAVLQAASYLAVADEWPPIKLEKLTEQHFPFWVAFDSHTAEGNRVFRDIARDLHIPLPQLEWTSFYFEGAKTNAETESKWWQKHCQWHFHKIGLPVEEAHLLWEPAKPQIMEALQEESRNLQGALYQWKLNHLEAVDALKKQVEIFNRHIDEVQTDQLDLF
ncbi:MAG: hypothetical protein PVF56_17075 [Desulfobacterales bacterium]